VSACWSAERARLPQAYIDAEQESLSAIRAELVKKDADLQAARAAAKRWIEELGKQPEADVDPDNVEHHEVQPPPVPQAYIDAERQRRCR
jgi:hypothetical protein